MGFFGPTRLQKRYGRKKLQQEDYGYSSSRYSSPYSKTSVEAKRVSGFFGLFGRGRREAEVFPGGVAEINVFDVSPTTLYKKQNPAPKKQRPPSSFPTSNNTNEDKNSQESSKKKSEEEKLKPSEQRLRPLPPVYPPQIVQNTTLSSSAAVRSSLDIVDYLAKFSPTFSNRFDEIYKTLTPEAKELIKNGDPTVDEMAALNITRDEMLNMKTLLNYEGLDALIKSMILSTEPSENDLKKAGLPRIDALRIRMIAISTNSILGFRPINESSKGLIEAGAMGKLFNTKGKSSLVQPLSAWIPFNSWCSKACEQDKDFDDNLEHVKTFQKENNSTVNKSNEIFYKMTMGYLMGLDGDGQKNFLTSVTIGKFPSEKPMVSFNSAMFKAIKGYIGANHGQFDAETEEKILKYVDLEARIGELKADLKNEGKSDDDLHAMLVDEFKKYLISVVMKKAQKEREEIESPTDASILQARFIELRKEEEYKNKSDEDLKAILINKSKVKFTDFVEAFNLEGLSDSVQHFVEIGGKKCEVFFLVKDHVGNLDPLDPINPPAPILEALSPLLDDDVKINSRQPVLIAKVPRDVGGGFDLYRYNYATSEYDIKIDDPIKIKAICDLADKVGDGLNDDERIDLLVKKLMPLKLLSGVKVKVKYGKDGELEDASLVQKPITADADRLFEALQKTFLLENNNAKELPLELERIVTILDGERDMFIGILVKFGLVKGNKNQDGSWENLAPTTGKNEKNEFLSDQERKFIIDFFAEEINSKDSRTNRTKVDVGELDTLKSIFKKFPIQDPTVKKFEKAPIKLEYTEQVLMQQMLGKLERRGSVTDDDLKKLAVLLPKIQDGKSIIDPSERAFAIEKLALLETYRKKESLESAVWYLDGGIMSHADLVMRTILRIDTKGNVNHGAEVSHFLHTEKFEPGNYPMFLPDGRIKVLELTLRGGEKMDDFHVRAEKEVCKFVNEMRKSGYPIPVNVKWGWKAYTSDSVVRRECTAGEVGDLYVPQQDEKIDFRKIDKELEDEEKTLEEYRETVRKAEMRASHSGEVRAGAVAQAMKKVRSRHSNAAEYQKLADEIEGTGPTPPHDEEKRKSAVFARHASRGDVLKKTVSSGPLDPEASGKGSGNLENEAKIIIGLHEAKSEFYGAFLKYCELSTEPRLIYGNIQEIHKRQQGVRFHESSFDDIKNGVSAEYARLLSKEGVVALEKCQDLWRQYVDKRIEVVKFHKLETSVFHHDSTSKITEFDKVFSKLENVLGLPLFDPPTLVRSPSGNKLDITPLILAHA